ncbi:hypothetical protein [Fibrivirga algicola]|uniref:Nucleotide exchange factor GrpE n=1 Tax=Fibrivirga algicola TaxID=2950420 RepID=A0ABX0QCK3_9BACT|nr:hypothetical protein [Fibrivirga algicola]NID10090.1 hypothetical protein [Fibrivirga algicola]
MNSQPTANETEQDLPDSNTLGGTESTGAGPDGEQATTPTPETTGLGHDDLDKADDVARRVDERNQEK